MNKYAIAIISGFLSLGLVFQAPAGQVPDTAIYKEHKVIYVSGGSQEVFNYPLNINLDSSDVYFTSADGQTPLYYYKEIAASPAAPRNDTSGVIASEAKQSRIFWVKIPRIPREGTTIHIYYNKRKLFPTETVSDTDKYLDPNKVFPFFDDFKEPVLNQEKWEAAPGLKKEYSIKEGYLQLKDGLIISRSFKIKQGIIEFKAKAEENAGIQAVVRAKFSLQAPFPYEQIVYSSNYPGAEHTIAINDIAKLNIGKPIQPLVFYIYKVVVNPAGIIFERYSQDYEKQAQIQFLDVGNLDEGYIGLKANAAPFNAGSVYFDWIRVRPYLEIEPKAIKN